MRSDETELFLEVPYLNCEEDLEAPHYIALEPPPQPLVRAKCQGTWKCISEHMQHLDLEREKLSEQRKMREVQERLLQVQLDAVSRPFGLGGMVVRSESSQGRAPRDSPLIRTKGHLFQPWAEGYKLNRSNSATGAYAAACVQVASSCGVDVLDLWTLMQKDNQDFTPYLSDGLHLSAKGNEFVAAHLWPLLEKKVSLLPTILPLWDEVNHLQPEASLLETTESMTGHQRE